MKSGNSLLFTLAALVALSFTVAGASFERQSSMTLKTDGERFVDAAGREVVLRGANAGMRSKMPPFFPFDPEPDFDSALEKFADTYNSLGFNAVRLLIIYEAAEPVRGWYDEDYLVKYDKMVKAFAERGIRVIVDSHQDIFSRRFCGDGFPDWAIAERYRDNPPHADCPFWELKNFKYSVLSSYDRLWNNKNGIQDRYVEFFRMLAERYAEEPGVIGFEPINEPMPGLQGMLDYADWYEQKLFTLYKRVGRVAHSVDERYLIFADNCPLENLGSWSSTRPRPDVKNLVFAPHYYDVGYVKFNLSTGRDKEIMRNGLKKHIKLGRHWGVPVHVGEYGVEMQREDAPDYIKKLYSIFDELKLSGTIWEASMSEKLWNGRDKNLFNPDGSLRPGTKALDRPYPMAVAGRIKSFSFNPDTGEFRLVYSENPDIKEPTEVYLPQRVYGDNPQVKVEPEGRYKYDAESGELTVYSVTGKSERRVEVVP